MRLHSETKQLPGGQILLTDTIRLSGTGSRLAGTVVDGKTTTILKRGTHPNGDLFTGPLISVEAAQTAAVRDLIIDGSRFAGGPSKKDLRHPITSDPTSADFPYVDHQRQEMVVECGPDVFVYDSSDATLTNLDVINPIRIGIGVGYQCRNVEIQGCSVRSAGDFGLWIASGRDPENPRLPLSQGDRDSAPQNISVVNSLIEKCGAAGIHTEGIGVRFEAVHLISNCHDAPYNDEGGQLTIDYKADDTLVRRCVIVAGGEVVRQAKDGTAVVHGCFGAEVCGSRVVFDDTTIEGNPREGVQIFGGRDIQFLGSTRVLNNHLAQLRHTNHLGHPERQNVSITTNRFFSDRNARSNKIRFDGATIQNGVIVWSDGSLPGLTLETLTADRSDFSGPDHSGIACGLNADGNPLRGANWVLRDMDDQT